MELNNKIDTIFLPSNEPYLGRESVFHFDNVILSCLEANKKIAAYTHVNKLSKLQQAACQIIPQGMNIALTIRELIRQGYLFGAIVLIRPLIERTAIISFLNKYPDKITLWENGWKYKERPSLASMLETMGTKIEIEEAKIICEMFGHIVHGDPVSAEWNLMKINENNLGYSVGKNINAPELCDFICIQSYCYLVVIMGMMISTFPE